MGARDATAVMHRAGARYRAAARRWLVGDIGQFVGLKNQLLAGLAFASNRPIQSRTGRSQSGEISPEVPHDV